MTEAEWSALLRTARSTATGPCPDAATLVALARGQLDPPARDAALDHVGACADCADSLRVAIDSHDFATAFAADLVAPAIEARTPAPRRRVSRFPAFALAASVLLAIGVTPWLLRAPTPDAVRGAAIAALAPADGARLDAAPARLAWDCASPAAVQVELLDATGELVWRGETSVCTVDLSPPARAAVDAGGDWLWQVRGGDGAVRAGPWRFHTD